MHAQLYHNCQSLESLANLRKRVKLKVGPRKVSIAGETEKEVGPRKIKMPRKLASWPQKRIASEQDAQKIFASREDSENWQNEQALLCEQGGNFGQISITSRHYKEHRKEFFMAL